LVHEEDIVGSQKPEASRQTATPCKSLYQINELIKIRLAITVLTISASPKKSINMLGGGPKWGVQNMLNRTGGDSGTPGLSVLSVLSGLSGHRGLHVRSVAWPAYNIISIKIIINSEVKFFVLPKL